MIFGKNNKFFKKNNYLLVAAAWLFTISFIINNYWSSTSTPSAVQNQIQRNINKQEKKIEDFYKDTDLVNSIADQKYNERQLDLLVEKNYYIFFYRIISPRDLLPVFWNTQIVEPDLNTVNSKDENSFRKLLNGWYVINKKSFQGKDGSEYKIVALIPVKWNYYIENQYLHNSFVAVDKIENIYDISLSPTSLEIKNKDGSPLFYLKQINSRPEKHDNIFALLLRILGSVLILFFIHKLANYYIKVSGFQSGLFILAGSLALLRIISYYLPIPFNFRHLELFNPSVYGSNIILKSLGDLFINSILFIWIVLFIRYHFKYDFSKIKFNSWFKKCASIIFISLLMILITNLCGYVIRSLVADSQISFDVINFFTLNIYSVIGFLVLSCIATGFFFLIQILLQPLNIFIGSRKYLLYLFISVTGLIFLSFRPYSSSISFNIFLLLWLLAFLFLLNFKFLLLQVYNLVSSKFIFWLFFFSVSITIVIVFQNRTKELEERKHFAENLANKADPSGPVIMNIMLNDFRNDYLSEIFYRFKDPGQNKFLKDSLVNENFSGYLNKYDTKIYTYDASELPLYNDDSTNFNSLNTIIKTQGKPTGIPDLFYYDLSYDRFNYISKKEITDTSGKILGYFFLISKPKTYKSDALYPELFSKGNKNSIESSPVYAFAIYNNNQLSTSYNDYPFSTSIDNSNFTFNEFKTVKKNGYEELWYRASGDKVIVIARQDRFFIESITLFAYLFCSFLIIAIFFNLINQLLTERSNKSDFKSFWQFTIRNQVHGTIILISIFSFLVIGITTILFFISRYHSNNREKLSRTIHVMENELRSTFDTIPVLEYGINNLNDYFHGKLESVINNVSNIHAADINLYDLNGNLKVSSLPLPYDKGIVSEKMDPVAYYHLSKLKDVQFFQEQKIGSLQYLSNYLPVRGESGKEYAYLNIPYFESQNKLQDEISNFLVTIINLNAFIFLIAGIIALFITNRITRSFSVITDRMKQVNLETGNEEIVWNRQDEIGDLVSEYNKMVKKLDISAEMLAKSEREGAWREMARQVAHEIKNPLTPMKLNLQYLQMAIDSNSPEVKKITLYVAGILLEQIEHLSKIASDFAQFANIGNTRNQLFNINQMLENVITLYATNDEIQINTDLYPHEILIEADKTQVNRLFTNLLQNAVQSVPDFRKVIIDIKSDLVDNQVLISIKDNGSGIPQSMFNKIFTPNFTTKTSGTGLGLAMTKGIVEKLNGKIWFETEQGKWTCFFVSIPIANA
ncbi:MAG: HAMP domain-containing sensor histidine kinase [Bacteroidota bacterium]|nr:HAMP domain-containing sensor histidine kinase [Bacteroidota bacterium]